ncbi:MAG: IS701 family transposase, partial [Myxococcota bacterium]
MNPAKCSSEDYIQWLIASPKVISATEASKSSPENGLVAHDAYTRLLGRLEPGSDTLWAEVEPFVDKSSGWLIVDDTTLDKPYGPHIELVTRHWSGKHRAVVDG